MRSRCRDRLGAPGRDGATQALADCAEALEAFTEAVYAADSDGT